MTARPDTAQPRPQLRRRDAIAIIVGIVIGAGIFKTPSMVAGATADGGWAIAAWVAGALVSLAGALCYAELATAYRHAGGDYHFLTRAYGRDASFLYAWARATVINTGAIALLAFVFGDYVSTVFPLGAASGAIWAAVIVISAHGPEHRRLARIRTHPELADGDRSRGALPPWSSPASQHLPRSRPRRPPRAARSRLRRRPACSASRWCSCC